MDQNLKSPWGSSSINEETKEEHYVLYTRRWYILLMSFLISLVQSLFWTTFAPVAKEMMRYFQTTEFMVNFQYVVAYIVFLPAIPFLAFVLASPQNLRRLFIASAFFIILGGVVRCFALINPTAWWSVWILTAGQVLNGIGGPSMFSSFFWFFFFFFCVLFFLFHFFNFLLVFGSFFLSFLFY